jgi:hypothetical protein
VNLRFALGAAVVLAAPSVAAHGPKLSIASDGRMPNGPRMGRPSHEMPLAFFGLRATETRVSGEGIFPGLTLASHSLGYFNDPNAHVNGRVGHFGYIGLERNGVEGGIGGDLSVGLFTPLGRHEGLVSRLGLRGHLLGNHAFYTSLVELPLLELGYQRIGRDFGFDLAARGGAVLIGRFNPDEAERRLGGSFEWGGVLALRVHHVDFNLDWTRIEARNTGPETPVDMLRGLVCAGARFFGVCMDARWSSGEVNSSAERKSITYLGLAVGGLGR